jgi:hypothetical protein
VALIETLKDPLDSFTATWGGSNTATYSNTFIGGRYRAGGSSTTPLPYAKIESVASYTLTNSSVYVQVFPYVGSASFRTFMRLKNANGQDLYFGCNGINLLFSLDNGTTIPYYTPYNATNDAWWRIRHSGSTAYFETSPDRATWTTKYTTSMDPTADFQLELGVHVTGGLTTDLYSYFDNVNGGGLLDSLIDDFTGTTLNSALWTPAGSGSASVSGGQLAITCSSGQSLNVTSKASYAIAGSWITAKMAPGAGQVAAITVVPIAGNGNVYVQVAGGTATFSARDSGNILRVSTSVAYNATTMAYWRISFTAGVSFEYSADGIAWTLAASAVTFAVAQPHQVYLQGQYSTGSGTTYFDKINIRPFAVTANPTGINDPDAIGNPAAPWIRNVSPTGINDPETLTAPTPGTLIETLIDDFDGPTLDSKLWTPGGTGTATISGGQLKLTSPSSYMQVAARSSYYLTGSRVTAKINVPVDNNGRLQLVAPSGPGFVRIIFSSLADIYAVDETGAARIPTAYVAYNPVTMPYWRISFAAGISVDYSADGLNWTVAKSAATFVTSLPYTVTLQTFGPSTAYFDKFNILPTVINPAGMNDPETINGPAVTFTAPPPNYVEPGSITDPDTTTGPDVDLAVTVNAEPDGITDDDTVNGPTITDYIAPNIVYPDSTEDPDTLGTPDVAFVVPAEPESNRDDETFGEPTLGVALWPEPDSLTDAETLGTPDLKFVPGTVYPAGIGGNEAIGTPAVTFMPGTLYPQAISDVGTIGTPSVVFKTFYTGGYGQGPYGVGLYSGMWIGLDPSITDPDALGKPELQALKAVIPASITDPDLTGGPALSGSSVGNALAPLSIVDPETLAAAIDVDFVGNDLYGQGLYGVGLYGSGQQGAGEPYDPAIPGTTNYNYGAGIYGEGIYPGSVGAPTDDKPRDNPTYGSGTYNYGIYYGPQKADVGCAPLFTNIVGTTRPPMHILGIGPWSPAIDWRGAPNYNIAAGARASRPAMALPATTSKGFTLRLNDGSEARTDLALPRGAAVIIDEMDTDLWWRRKDPRTNELEVIGRFNTSHVNTATSDTGVTVSCQFDDYQTLLADRLVLKYKDTKHNESLWDKNTKVTDILAFAIPGNTRLDLSEVTGTNPYDLGTITQPYHLPPGTAVGEVFEQLVVISKTRWEWWIETPADIDAPPKLRFQIGTRGLDKGVVLHDLGKGPSNIASWVRNGAADSYANSLNYSGSDGSVVEVIDDDIIRYGQRDATASNSNLDGTQMDLLRAAAKRKLEKLADRTPTYTVILAAGFWRGRKHIDVGDTVTLIIRLGKDHFDQKYRVAEIAVEIDDVGMETVTLTLGTPHASADGRSKKSPLMRIVRYLIQYTAPKGALEIPTDE